MAPEAEPEVERGANAAADHEIEPAAEGASAPIAAQTTSNAQMVGWIVRIAERDQRALQALYQATRARAYGWVLHIVRRSALAEEVVADTYFQVWRQADRFDANRGRALTWLLGMAHSRAIDALRRERRFNHVSVDDEAAELDLQVPQTVDDPLDAVQAHALLHAALQTLGAQRRQLVAMAFLRGLSHEEISVQTALPLGTVKSQIRRALMNLRHLMGSTKGELT